MSAPWTFRDLTDAELRDYLTLKCECLTPRRAGTRNGYTCAAHRAQAELDRRAAAPSETPREGQDG